MKKLLIFTLLLSTVIPLLPVVLQTEVWQDNNGNYRYFLGDYHVDYPDGQQSTTQQNAIVRTIQKLRGPHKESRVFCIAEDLGFYDRKNILSAAHEERFPKTLAAVLAPHAPSTSNNSKSDNKNKTIGVSSLRGILHRAKENKILGYNAECAHKVILYEDGYITDRTIVIADLLEHLNKLDSLQQHASTKKYVGEIASDLKTLQQLPASTDHETFCKQALTIRHALVNLKSLNQLIRWNNIPHGFIFTGQDHINVIKKYLPTLGYKKISAFGVGTDGDANALILACDNPHLCISYALNIDTTFNSILAQQATTGHQKIRQAAIAQAHTRCSLKPFVAVGLLTGLIVLWKSYNNRLMPSNA